MASYVGVDVHQATLVVSVRDEQGSIARLEERGSRMRAEGLLAELDVLQQLRCSSFGARYRPCSFGRHGV